MEFFIVLVIAVIVVGVNMGKLAGKADQGEQKKKPASGAAAKTGAARQSLQKSAASERAPDKLRWAEAKKQQDDAEQLHAVHVDSCESKLESIRILYEAGILDREEYEQRKTRIRAKHNAAS